MRRPGPSVWLAMCACASLSTSAWLAWQTLAGPAGWRHHQRLSRALAEQQADSARLAAQTAALHRRIEALANNPAAQEHAVRDHLGWLRPGELVVHFPADDP